MSRFPLRNQHNIVFTNINNSNFTASTQESNPSIALWNHDMSMQEVENGRTLYTDAITLYAGLTTGIL